MRLLSYILITSLAIFGLATIAISGFHLGGPFLVSLFQFSQLTSALLGGIIAFVSANIPMRSGKNTEPWLSRERLCWTLIGFGLIMWGIGEAFWRYYVSIHQSPFPSFADIGYASLPPLVFAGLVLQPSSNSGTKRLLMIIDSLISTGSILAIAWYLLLGSLTQFSVLTNLGKFLRLYYPTTDVALLSCVVLLLLRSREPVYQVRARRIGLLVVAIGLCFFVASDFIYNLQQNAGTYVRNMDTWVDLGWPLGMLLIGLAAYLRRFLPATSAAGGEQRAHQRTERITFGPAQLTPYVLLSILFIVLVLNILSSDPAQRSLRPVLLFVTLAVIGLFVVRQILTMQDNERLTLRQAEALARLELANRRVEDQASIIAEHNAELETGVMHLKEVQAQLSNGNLRARANLTKGELLPLAASLNHMADRLMRLEQSESYLQHLTASLADLSVALERYRAGGPLIVPSSSTQLMEINRLLLAMGLKKSLITRPLQPASPSAQPPAPRRPTARKLNLSSKSAPSKEPPVATHLTGMAGDALDKGPSPQDQ